MRIDTPQMNRIRTYETEGVIVVEIHGRMTERSSNLHRLRDTAHSLREAGKHHVVLDLGEVTKLDGSGMGEIVAACIIAAKNGGTVVVARISKAAQRALDRMIVSPFPRMGGGPFNSVSDAVRALRTGHGT